MRTLIVTVGLALLVPGIAVRAQDEPAVPKPAAEVQPSAPFSETRAKQLISELNNEDFAVRERAAEELKRHGETHQSAMLEMGLNAMVEAKDPETKYRLGSIIYSIRRAVFMAEPRGFVGIRMATGTTVGVQGGFSYAVRILEVIADSAAERNGLRAQDLITAVDSVDFSKDIDATYTFGEYIGSRQQGDPVTLKITRGREKMNIKIELGKRPPNLLESSSIQYRQFESNYEKWLNGELEKRRATPKS